ncbi:MAG: hypothetical protein J3K34DRAFT_516226 [Monoraphidium minutum]|nr:MAG: hypothetical protein J3K34DRAFT_516226 [Monoraphidium minutum]
MQARLPAGFGSHPPVRLRNVTPGSAWLQQPQCAAWRTARRALARAAAAAAGADAAAAPAAAAPSTSAAAPPPPPQQQQQQRPPRAPWGYKYPRARGPSPCRPGDDFCAQLDALAQAVLAYPYTPPRVARRLDALRPAGIDAITARVEAAADHYGAELALGFISRAPELLLLDFETTRARAAAAAAALGLPEAEMPALLIKSPQMLLLEPAELRARYDALPRALRLAPQQAHALVLKYPPVLSRRTASLAFMAGQLRHLAGARSQWSAELEAISPSLMAFFLRDYGDQVRRLEYLASTGESPGIHLREVMKPSNRLFAAQHRGFAGWSHAVRRRRQQQAALAARAAARAEPEGGRGEAPAAAEQQQQQGGGGGAWAGDPQQRRAAEEQMQRRQREGGEAAQQGEQPPPPPQQQQPPPPPPPEPPAERRRQPRQRPQRLPDPSA